ncbi:hypothetical protein [Sorangium sp. So ce854]|uniref:hypothetical protein n=1 Tax=Sorangium sp. So ce854 TaxID=3133322 RepID=UPI003F634B7C
MTLCAVYVPVEPPLEPPSEVPNPCHFVIIPPDDRIEDLLVKVRDFMGSAFPSGFPGHDRQKQRQALEAKRRYECALLIVRDVLKPNAVRSASSEEQVVGDAPRTGTAVNASQASCSTTIQATDGRDETLQQ